MDKPSKSAGQLKKIIDEAISDLEDHAGRVPEDHGICPRRWSPGQGRKGLALPIPRNDQQRHHQKGPRLISGSQSCLFDRKTPPAMFALIAGEELIFSFSGSGTVSACPCHYFRPVPSIISLAIHRNLPDKAVKETIDRSVV